MKTAVHVALIVAGASVLLGIVLRASFGGLPSPAACLRFADTALLAAIALLLMQRKAV